MIRIAELECIFQAISFGEIPQNGSTWSEKIAL
jgi:hypothetical protein